MKHEHWNKSTTIQPERPREQLDNPNFPLGEFDAQHWAAEFCRILFKKEQEEGFVLDPLNTEHQSWLLAWYASAIMTGYEHGLRHNKLRSSVTDVIEFYD